MIAPDAHLIGEGDEHRTLSESTVYALVERAFAGRALTGKRLLVIIPDSTRTAPLPLMFRALYEVLGNRVARLDYLIALGTHPPLGRPP